MAAQQSQYQISGTCPSRKPVVIFVTKADWVGCNGERTKNRSGKLGCLDREQIARYSHCAMPHPDFLQQLCQKHTFRIHRVTTQQKNMDLGSFQPKMNMWYPEKID